VSLVGPGGLLAGITKTVLEAALDVEMSEHLGYDKGDPAGRGSGNHRNGSSPKTVLTEIGPGAIDVPRDRNGVFEPQIVPKHSPLRCTASANVQMGFRSGVPKLRIYNVKGGADRAGRESRPPPIRLDG
jgi:transposase-like protein